MTTTPILKIGTDDNQINLLDKNGWHVDEWNPSIAGYKGGGEKRESASTDGTRLVHRAFEAGAEVINLVLSGGSSDSFVRRTQEMRRMLEQAADFSINATGKPVYLTARAAGETKTRYAHVIQGALNGEENPFAQPFLQPQQKRVGDDYELAILRDHWSETKPLAGQCAPAVLQGDLSIDSFEERIADTNPLAWWKLNETSGSVAANSTPTAGLAGSYGAGAIVGAATFLNGEAMVEIDTVANSVVDVYSAALNSGFDGDGFSFAMWTNMPTIVWSGANPNYFVRFRVDANNDFYVRHNATAYTAELYYIVDGNAKTLTISNVISGWNYFMVRIGVNPDPNYPSDWLKISFEFGGKTAFAYLDPGAGWTGNLSSSYAVLGSSDNTGPGFGDNVDGYLAQATLWNRRLTDAEAQSVRFDYRATTSLQTCSPVMLTNRVSTGQITNIKVFDAGGASYTDVSLDSANLPEALLPAAPAVGDISYWGAATTAGIALPGAPFSNWVANIQAGAGLTGTWEYYDGATWSTLPGATGNNNFAENGYSQLVWRLPSNWSTTAINGVTAYWIRYRVTAVSSPTAPELVEFVPFAGRQPIIHFPASSVPGDVPAALTLNGRISTDISAPKRAFIGARSQQRGDGFSAYLNFSDNTQQNPDGVVAANVLTTLASDPRAPGLERAEWNPAGVVSMTSLFSFTLNPTIASQYDGEFRVLLRVKRTGGDDDDLNVRVSFNFINEFTTDARQVLGTDEFELLDFGMVTIVAVNKSGDQPAIGFIYVQGECTEASTPPDLYLYDLILIPVDEWFGEFRDESGLGYLDGMIQFVVDGVAYPWNEYLAFLQDEDTGGASSALTPRTVARPVLQPNLRQKLWFLFADVDPTIPQAHPDYNILIATTIKTHYLSAIGDGT